MQQESKGIQVGSFCQPSKGEETGMRADGILARGLSPFETDEGELEHGLAVYRLSPGVYTLPMSIGGVKVQARIDSGAMISIMSTQCFERLAEKPEARERVRLILADREGETVGRFVDPVWMEIGKKKVKQSICVRI